MSSLQIGLNPLRFSNIRTIFFSNLILGLCNGFYNVLYQPYIVQFIDNTKQLGVILTLSSVMQSTTLILTSKVSDKRGRRIVYLSGLLLFAVSMLIYAQAFNVVMVISALLIFTFAIGTREPAKQALVAESADKHKTTSSFSLVNIAFYATGLVGPIIVRVFAGKVDLKFYFYGLLGGFVILYLFQLFYLRESLLIKNIEWSYFKDFLESIRALFVVTKQYFISVFYFLSFPFYILTKNRTKTKSNRMRNYYRIMDEELALFSQIFQTKGVRYALAYFIFDAFVWGLSVSIFFGSVVLVYNFTEADIALINLVFSVSTILFFIPVTLLSDRLERNEILFLSQVVGSLYITMNILAFFLPENLRLYAIFIAWVGLGGSVAFWVPGIMSIMSSFDPRRRSELYGTVSGLQSLGWLPTSIIAGFIIDHSFFVVPFIISLVLLPLDMFLAWKFPKKTVEDEVE